MVGLGARASQQVAFQIFFFYFSAAKSIQFALAALALWTRKEKKILKRWEELAKIVYH